MSKKARNLIAEFDIHQAPMFIEVRGNNVGWGYEFPDLTYNHPAIHRRLNNALRTYGPVVGAARDRLIDELFRAGRLRGRRRIGMTADGERVAF